MTATSAVASACFVALFLVMQTSATADKTRQLSLSDFYMALPVSDQEMLGQYFAGTRAFKRKSGADPNFLRFGKRAATTGDDFQLTGREPNFLRFGRADPSALANNNFLRFGKRSIDIDEFERSERKPNFLRFG
ncbi:hypothetical protein M3Y94_00737400 [Aphelenchoides besseyi]|nr:hypothetical protein M3Y94_00737400 [Aphelenchoides besseyi]KAI6231947.1 hypothetical protein M3Y95_00435300 [Aphelenchoides besseyi]